MASFAGNENERGRVKVRVKFAWYDLWVGAYIDRERRTLYVCPLPTLLLIFERRPT